MLRLNSNSLIYPPEFQRFGGIFDYDQCVHALREVELALADPALWQDVEKAKQLNQKKNAALSVVEACDQMASALADLEEWFVLAQEGDEEAGVALTEELSHLAEQVEKLEFRRMFCGEMDHNNAYLDIQSGSGGTEAQDWAEMLLRMYLRWSDQHGFKASVVSVAPGDVAGIKGATIFVEGQDAFGWLRTETGVHRLVRKSPFDSGNRRHTSFASVFVSPEVSDEVEVDLNPADIRVDTYRASGAGGQHVNKTDSAVRLTHAPSGVVVQCQNDRSQHKNKAQAMKQLKAKLYELALQEKAAEKSEQEGAKLSIGWGSQIRSYVLDQSRVKDLRTQVETSNTQAVLDGGIDLFIEACLKQQVDG